MRHLILGTAGHIDHGKSALVRSLTGTDPDRLQEEKRRGITIELGFADTELGPGRVLSFVDVPGHERFVRHMVAGVGGLDAVLLVVAADQGVQPQTREHLEICSLLGIPRGVVALTKCDLVDAELCEVATLELQDLLQGTFLDGAAVIPVSAQTGEGLDALRSALDGLLDTADDRDAGGPVRLPVDRSFVLRGFGAVVTGTLVSGSLREGQEVEILPGGARGRVRGLQVHRRKVELAPAGRRVAVNLQGLDCSDVPRGATIVSPAALAPTLRAWARLELLPSAPDGLERGGEIRFHQGTCDVAGRFRALGRADDGRLAVELRFREPAVVAPRDRFILRRPAPVNTIAGGVIVDAHPPPARGYDPSAFAVAALEPQRALRIRLARAGPSGRSVPALCRELGVSPEDLEAAFARVEAAGAGLRAGSRRIDAAAWAAAASRAREAVEAFHAALPLRAGIGRELLRARVAAKMPVELWREMLLQLESEGAIRLQAEHVALAGHRVLLEGPQLQLAQRIESRYRDAGLEPPGPDEIVAQDERELADSIIQHLIHEGRLVRIQDGKLFHAEALEGLRGRMRDYAKSSRTIDVGRFKELAGVTRKNAIPLLEQLDAERATRRKGNVREILL